MRRKKKRRKKAVFEFRKKDALRVLKFLIRFNLFAIPLYLIIISGFQWGFLKDLTTDISFFLLRTTGIDASLSGNMISIPAEGGSFAATIDWDCTGWKSMFALFALIFATDFSLRKKLYGLVLIPLVYLANILRIWFMFYFVSNFGLLYYDIVHSLVWSWGLILIILILWVVWMKTFRDTGNKLSG
jgi:exosortase/archaeosortase family protein